MSESSVLTKRLYDCLPRRFCDKFNETIRLHGSPADELTELRLRCGRISSVTVNGKNVIVDVRLTCDEIAECVSRLCCGSVYAHADTIGMGYINFGEGIRIGVCGTLSPGTGGVREFGSVNIRLPHIIRGVADGILRICCGSRILSVLIYSPPGVGKTTILRDIAASIGGRYSRRVSIIDSRGELYIEKMFRETLCDVLVGYPKALGIEIATRTMSPEVIICDELGDAKETEQILCAQNTGVPIIASAHASDIDELMSRPNIRRLHDNGVFSCYIGVSRQNAGGELGKGFVFDTVMRKEIECMC